MTRLRAESAGWGGTHHGASFLVSSHWQQPGEEAWRGLSPVTSPLLQLHLPPWDAVPASSGQSWPHTLLRWQVELKSSKALSPRLSARKRRPQSPGSGQWAATSWPALSSQHQSHPAHPQEAQRANVQVRVISQTPSPQGKDCSRNTGSSTIFHYFLEVSQIHVH